ncbi:MAG: MBL fold metallo-hydrolase [Alphaproteobacteria bacterium]|nr:MBL fold metallo-hydrolase [Alphaproteobacteria bacterium]
MKVTILGCGNSGGVPLIGNKWGACDPGNPRNRRRRASALVEEGDTTLLIDTSPDLREQLLACNLQHLTAVLYTHFHADHTHGIDDLREVNWLTHEPIPIYADKEMISEIQNRFAYVFPEYNRPPGKFHRPVLEPHIIDSPLQFGSITVNCFKQQHGNIETLGFRFNDFAYSSDVNSLDEKAFKALRGVKVWVVDAIREYAHPTHSYLEQTLGWIEKVNPDKAYLTHMDQSMDYATISAKLPKNVEPSYDGLVIEI